MTARTAPQADPFPCLGEMRVGGKYVKIYSGDVPALRAENQRLREALQRLNRAYEADSESAPDMSVRMAFETNSQAHAQARAALKGE